MIPRACSVQIFVRQSVESSDLRTSYRQDLNESGETTMNALAAVFAPALRAPARPGLAGWLLRIGALLKEIGPYAAIELILPGGTLLAVLFWLYRRHKRRYAVAA
jgi:hypothetical protein